MKNKPDWLKKAEAEISAKRQIEEILIGFGFEQIYKILDLTKLSYQVDEKLELEAVDKKTEVKNEEK